MTVDDLSKLSDEELWQRLEDDALPDAEYEAARAELCARAGLDPDLVQPEKTTTGEISEQQMEELLFDENANGIGSYYAKEASGDETDHSRVSTFYRKDEQVFETMLLDLKDYDDQSILVEKYDTEDDAVVGHAKWAHMMEMGTLPDPIMDIDGKVFTRHRTDQRVR